VAWNAVRGCGCRSRAARRATPEGLPGRHRPARALPSRSADHGRERRAEARAVRRDVSGADFTRAKPSWPSTPRALERKLLAHPGHEFGPGDPGGVVSARFVA
jgi:hypothetical protein